MMQNVKKKSGGETIVKKLVSPKRKICFFADAEDGQEIGTLPSLLSENDYYGINHRALRIEGCLLE